MRRFIGPVSLETIAELVSRGTLRDWEKVLVEWRRGEETRLLEKQARACLPPRPLSG